MQGRGRPHQGAGVHPSTHAALRMCARPCVSLDVWGRPTKAKGGLRVPSMEAPPTLGWSSTIAALGTLIRIP